jgi:hypothetical protein
MIACMWWRQLLSWTVVTLRDPTLSCVLFLFDCISPHNWKKCVRSASGFLFIKFWKGIHTQVDPEANSMFLVFVRIVSASKTVTEVQIRGKMG